MKMGVYAAVAGDRFTTTCVCLTGLAAIVAGLTLACDTEPVKPRFKRSVAIIALAHWFFVFYHYFIPFIASYRAIASSTQPPARPQ